MGADISIEIPENLDLDRLYKECREVPIDIRVEDDKIHFHYAYWGIRHALNCERFVNNFCKKYNLKLSEWGY